MPAAPGEEPEPASFGPVLFEVPERLVPVLPVEPGWGVPGECCPPDTPAAFEPAVLGVFLDEPPSAAQAALPRRRVLAMASVTAFMRLSLSVHPMGEGNATPLRPFRAHS